MPAAGTLDSVCSGHGSFPSRQTAEADAGLSINGKAVSGRPWFTINGKGIVCVDDQVSCGSTVATGDAGFQVN